MTSEITNRHVDLRVVRCARPGKTCAESAVLLARARSSGTFELLTEEAWAQALGYLRDELTGMSLESFMDLDTPAPGGVVAAVLDETAKSFLVRLRSKHARRKVFRLHLWFDPYERAMFLVADEVLDDSCSQSGGR